MYLYLIGQDMIQFGADKNRPRPSWNWRKKRWKKLKITDVEDVEDQKD